MASTFEIRPVDALIYVDEVEDPQKITVYSQEKKWTQIFTE